MLVGANLSFDAVDGLSATRKRGLMRAQPAHKAHKKVHAAPGRSKTKSGRKSDDNSMF
jgi:hypothetical protein